MAGMQKILFLRGPDGAFHEFHRTPPLDEWVPLPGQDVQIQSALTGAGWFLVASVRPVLTGSEAHNQIKIELDHQVTTVRMSRLEVYLEVKRVNPCPECGATAMMAARFCFHCGHELPAEGAAYGQPAPRPRPPTNRH